MIAKRYRFVAIDERVIRLRLVSGDLFNAYKQPSGFGWLVTLGPISDCARIADAPDEASAVQLVDLLRLCAKQPRVLRPPQDDQESRG